jgi:hypothetical protein
MNTNLIIKNIDLTVDIFNQNPSYKDKKIRDLGFHYVVGYIDMIKSLNEMSALDVSIIIKELRDEGGQYKDFSNHIILDNVLKHSIFENLNIEENVFSAETFEDNKYKLFYEIYSKENTDLNTSDYQKEFYDKIKGELDSNLTKNQELENFKNKIDYNVMDWLRQNLRQMNSEEFYMFIQILYKLKYDRR